MLSKCLWLQTTGYSESTGCAHLQEMNWAHLTHLEPCARSGHKGNSNWASGLTEGSLSTYGKGGSVSITMNGFWQPDQIKSSNSSSRFSPSVCKSHNLCPTCSCLQHPDYSRHLGVGLDCLCFDCSSLCPWMLCRVKGDWVWSLDASRNCVMAWMFSLTFSSSVGPLFPACCTIPKLVQETTYQISVRSAGWTHPHSFAYGERKR